VNDFDIVNTVTFKIHTQAVLDDLKFFAVLASQFAASSKKLLTNNQFIELNAELKRKETANVDGAF
jgi:hypothetical protein